jgi:exonuclease VII large subunit
VIKNKRLAKVIKKALKESHQDEIHYRETSLSELNKSLELNRRKQDRLYDSYLDEIVNKDVYERKQKQIKFEEEAINESIKKQSQANTKYYELGVNIFELSQRAKEIYSDCKSTDKKRQLLSIAFENMTLNEGNLSVEYSPAFETLSKAIKATNGSKVAVRAKSGLRNFEPKSLGLSKRKTPALASACPQWWTVRDSNP